MFPYVLEFMLTFDKMQNTSHLMCTEFEIWGQSILKVIQAFHTARVGISGTTAKSRQRKFVPSSHTGPFALVASPGKSKTKVVTLACFDFLWKNEQTM